MPRNLKLIAILALGIGLMTLAPVGGQEIDYSGYDLCPNGDDWWHCQHEELKQQWLRSQKRPAEPAPHANRQGSDPPARKVRVLAILADNDPLVGPTVKFDAALMRFLLREQIPRENLAEPVVLLGSRDEVTVSGIFRALQELKVGPSDVLLCFYSGPGGLAVEGPDLDLRLPDGTSLLARKTLKASLKGKGARLAVLIADCLSPGACLSLGDEQLPLKIGNRSPGVLSHLFFEHEGFSLIYAMFLTSSKRAFYFQQSTPQGQESLGSIFMREFVKECTTGQSAQENAPDWKAMLLRIADAGGGSCNIAALLALGRGGASLERGFASLEQREFREAVEAYSELIRLTPTKALGFLKRGDAYTLAGEPEKAVRDFTEALRLEPNNAEAFSGRGNARRIKGEYDGAIRDYSEAIRIEPNCAGHFFNRGGTWANKGEFDKAIRDYEEAVRINPEREAFRNPLAWMLATCPDDRARDGKRALEHATRVCELSDWKNWVYLDTLAAAYAETGQFDKAVEYQQKVIDLGPSAEDKRFWENQKEDCQKRLKLYQAGQPYRETPAPKKDR